MPTSAISWLSCARSRVFQAYNADLMLRRPRSGRLEAWAASRRLCSSFETRPCGSLLRMRWMGIDEKNSIVYATRGSTSASETIQSRNALILRLRIASGG